MDAAKQILIVAPSAKLSGADKKLMEDAGFVVVRGVPSDFRLLDAMTIPERGMILRSALCAIAEGGWDVRQNFGDRVIAELMPKEKNTNG